jgi:hypothetical protein
VRYLLDWTGITGAREPRAKRMAFEACRKLMRVAALDADAPKGDS